MYFLADPSWQEAQHWEDVDAAGRALLTRLNGLLRILGSENDPLRFGGVVLLKEAGGRDYYEKATGTMGMSGSAVEEHIGPEGEPVPPPPGPLGGWLRRAEGDSKLEEAVRLFATANDWFDLYKVYELARAGLGGQSSVDELLTRPLRNRLTQTAQHHRHADKPLPKAPLTFEEADRVVAQLLVAWLA
ncbi:MAG TPA: hypothetical protein VHQ98_00735 [Gaiellaceae bacterium]|nr:hypothetical protein [Gaiellaceae bacterium]